MTNWTITVTSIGTVTLNRVDSVAETNPARVEYFDPDSGESDAFACGRGAQSITVSGELWGSGLTNSTIESGTLAYLRSMQGTIVTVSSPDSQYTGNWIMAGADWERTNEYPVFYTYSIKLVRGGTILAIG